MKGYLANGTDLEDRATNSKIETEIGTFIPMIQLYVPDDFDVSFEQLSDFDFLIAVLEDVEFNIDVAVKIGIFAALRKPVYIIASKDEEINPFIEEIAMKNYGYITTNYRDLVRKLAHDIYLF